MRIATAVAQVIKVIGTEPEQVRGLCYAASEAIYHLAGGKRAGLTPVVHRLGVGSHWWLRTKTGEVIDVTAAQFSFRVKYRLGRGCGFLSKQPSAMAETIIRKARRVR